MKTPHVHAEVIKAWADGENIQYRTGPLKTWIDIPFNLGWPMWADEWEYRVKPEPKPDIVQSIGFRLSLTPNPYLVFQSVHNVKLIFDGETRELKSVELIK